MNNQKERGISISDAPREWRRAFHRGWVDKQHRLPFCREYDLAMGHRQQTAYEQGRLLAAGAFAAKLPFPSWRGFKAGASVMDNLSEAVFRQIGEIVPHGNRS